MRAGQASKVIAATILLVVPAVPSFGQETPAKMVDNDFEKPLVDGMPAGWVGVPEDTVQLDEGTSFSGDQSIRLARDETNQESTYTAFRASCRW